MKRLIEGSLTTLKPGIKKEFNCENAQTGSNSGNGRAALKGRAVTGAGMHALNMPARMAAQARSTSPMRNCVPQVHGLSRLTVYHKARPLYNTLLLIMVATLHHSHPKSEIGSILAVHRKSTIIRQFRSLGGCYTARKLRLRTSQPAGMSLR